MLQMATESLDLQEAELREPVAPACVTDEDLCDVKAKHVRFFDETDEEGTQEEEGGDELEDLIVSLETIAEEPEEIPEEPDEGASPTVEVEVIWPLNIS